MPRKNNHQWSAFQPVDAVGAIPPPSRSEKKRQSLALQELGEELTRLAPQEVKKLDLPSDLEEALVLYGRIGTHEGRRRQLQFIGRIMRDLDPEPVRAALNSRREKSVAATTALHKAEQWRERLLTADEDELPDLIATLLANLPVRGAAMQSDITDVVQPDALHALARAARKEEGEHMAPHARRALFRAVHGLLTSR